MYFLVKKITRKRIINYLIVFFFAAVWGTTKAQTVIGTTGMMNVPTADMRAAGTFDGGASFIQKELLYEKSYNTYLYFIGFTPFPWLEITMCETLLQTNMGSKKGFDQQDRSTSVRLRPLKEGNF